MHLRTEDPEWMADLIIFRMVVADPGARASSRLLLIRIGGPAGRTREHETDYPVQGRDHDRAVLRALASQTPAGLADVHDPLRATPDANDAGDDFPQRVARILLRLQSRVSLYCERGSQ